MKSSRLVPSASACGRRPWCWQPAGPKPIAAGPENLVASPPSNFLLCENLDLLSRVQSLAERGLRLGGSDSALVLQVWLYADLLDLVPRQLAAEAALQAETILLISRAEGATPDPVRVWFESWLARKRTLPNQLIALFVSETSRATGSVRKTQLAYLSSIALTAGLKFSAPNLNGAAEFAPLAEQPGLTTLAMAAQPATAEVQTWRHWGINE